MSYRSKRTLQSLPTVKSAEQAEANVVGIAKPSAEQPTAAGATKIIRQPIVQGLCSATRTMQQQQHSVQGTAAAIEPAAAPTRASKPSAKSAKQAEANVVDMAKSSAEQPTAARATTTIRQPIVQGLHSVARKLQQQQHSVQGTAAAIDTIRASKPSAPPTTSSVPQPQAAPVPPLITSAQASKLCPPTRSPIVGLSRSTRASTLMMKQQLPLINSAQPSLQAQSGASPSASKQVQKPTSVPAAAQPVIRSPAIKFGPFQPSSSGPGSHPTCETSSTPTAAQGQSCGTSSPLETEFRLPPPITRATNKEVPPKSIPSVEKGKDGNKGKKKKARKSSSGTSSQSSWQDGITFDAKEEVLTIDDQGNEEVINGSIQPRDVMNYKKGVRFCVAFNNYNQPIRKGGYIFVRFLGYIAKQERFCPIGTTSWHKLNKTYQVDIIEMVRSKFVYPSDKSFDKRVLKHVAKHFKQYKHSLKRDYFKPKEKTKEEMYDVVPNGHSRDGWIRLVDYWCSNQHESLAGIGREARASQTHFHTTGSTSYAEKRADFVEAHGREPTHLEFFKDTHSKQGGGFVADTATESLLSEARSKVQERLLSSPSKTQAEIENEVFDELMYEEDNPKRPVGFGFNVDRSDVFGVNGVLRKRGCTFHDNDIKLKRVKEELASQKSMFLLILKAMRNGQITNDVLDATEAALRRAGGDQVSDRSSGNDIDGQSGGRSTGPSTSHSQAN